LLTIYAQTVVLCFALIYAYATAGFICFPQKFAFDNSGAFPLISYESSPMKTFLLFALACFARENRFSSSPNLLAARKFCEFFFSEVESGDTDAFNVNSAHCDTLWKCLLVSIDQVSSITVLTGNSGHWE
jgi:hypothetical protein